MEIFDKLYKYGTMGGILVMVTGVLILSQGEEEIGTFMSKLGLFTAFSSGLLGVLFESIKEQEYSYVIGSKLVAGGISIALIPFFYQMFFDRQIPYSGIMSNLGSIFLIIGIISFAYFVITGMQRGKK